MTTERGQRGGQLVFVDADGARRAHLTRAASASVTLDRSPAFSPDGEWVAFASTRGRDSLAETSLWIVSAEPRSEPRRLTDVAAVDRDPVWDPEGDSIIFSSSRGDSFDLYELPVAQSEGGPPRPAGEPRALTSTPTQALSPSVSPDGSQVAYMAVDEASHTTSIWLLDRRTLAQKALTEGPRDATPAFSPRGDEIAFAAPGPGRPDADLFVVDPAGGERRRITDEPLADQSGPAFSPDGRYVFATAVYRSAATGRPILSSVVAVDRRDPRAELRGLHDPAVVAPRIGVAVRPGGHAGAEIAENPPYEEALRDAVARELRRERREERDRGAENEGGGPSGG